MATNKKTEGSHRMLDGHMMKDSEMKKMMGKKEMKKRRMSEGGYMKA